MQQLHHHLTELKLSGIKQALEQQAINPSAYQELSFNERLVTLLEHEINGRKQRRIERLIKQARFRLSANINQLDYRASRDLQQSQVRALIDGQWVVHYQNLIITGATGCGKTYLACALGDYYCRQSMSVYYYRLKGLLEEMYMAQAQGTYRKLITRLTSASILVLDDWGLESLSPTQRSDLLELIDARYGSKSTIIASQLPVENWYEMIGESTHADAILDRIVHSSIKLDLKGESMRKLKNKLTDGDQIN